MYTETFLVRDSIYAEHAVWYHPSACLSVHLSVTRVDQSKMVEVRFKQLSPQSNPIAHVFAV